MSTELITEKKSSPSLYDFFDASQEVNLNNCDREPVHMIGVIQDSGALLVLDPDTQRIVAMSDNVGRLFGFDTLEELEDVDYLRDIFAELAEVLEEAPVSRKSSSYVPLEYVNDVEGNTYNAIHHHHNGYDYVELWQEKPLTASRLRQVLQSFHQQNSEILKASSLEEALQVCLGAVRAMTGADRVVIYTFLPDWSGHVIAEDKGDHMPSFMDLRFPATDIPKQARYLMNIVPYRATTTVQEGSISALSPAHDPEGKPFDLTWSLLRGTSKIHMEYLRNMEVGGSFVVPLLLDGKLWGALTCNFKEPKTLPFDTMNFVQDFGNSLMNVVDQEESTAHLKKVNATMEIEREIVTLLVQTGELQPALAQCASKLLALMNAEGFAFKYGEKLFVSGEVPPADFIDRLIDWSSKQEWENGYFITEALHELFPESKEHINTACGVLVDHIRQNGKSHMIWFRAPIVQTITWAGNPDEKFGPERSDEPEVLTPRKSFESWTSEYNDRSGYWGRPEVVASRQLAKNLLGIVSPPNPAV